MEEGGQFGPAADSAMAMAAMMGAVLGLPPFLSTTLRAGAVVGCHDDSDAAWEVPALRACRYIRCITIPMVDAPINGHQDSESAEPNTPRTTSLRVPDLDVLPQRRSALPADSSVVCGH